MSEEVNKEQTKDVKQEKIPELPEGKLDEVVGGTGGGTTATFEIVVTNTGRAPLDAVKGDGISSSEDQLQRGD